jgi:protein gp37
MALAGSVLERQMDQFFSGISSFRGVPGHPYEAGFRLRLVPEKIDEPLRWRTPLRIFVNSMSDLFHDGVSEDYIAQVGRTMQRANWDTFQVLTKFSTVTCGG